MGFTHQVSFWEKLVPTDPAQKEHTPDLKQFPVFYFRKCFHAFLGCLGPYVPPGAFLVEFFLRCPDIPTLQELRQSVATVGGANWPGSLGVKQADQKWTNISRGPYDWIHADG